MNTIRTPTGVVTRIRARGSAVLSTPTINRGTAFTLEERQVLGSTGLLPPQVTTLDGQPLYVYAQYRAQTSDLGRNVYFPALLRGTSFGSGDTFLTGTPTRPSRLDGET
jgi:malate dehydrogenase (oxaloacetate-decarboxylating)